MTLVVGALRVPVAATGKPFPVTVQSRDQFAVIPASPRCP